MTLALILCAIAFALNVAEPGAVLVSAQEPAKGPEGPVRDARRGHGRGLRKLGKIPGQRAPPSSGVLDLYSSFFQGARTGILGR